MLDYSSQAVTSWFERETIDRTNVHLPPPVRIIETRGDAPGLLEDLGHLLESLARVSPDSLSHLLQTAAAKRDLTQILAQVGIARVIRFLHWLDEADVPDSHLIVAGLIEGDRPEVRALRAVIYDFAQRQVIARVFEADRLEALQEATETALKGRA